MQFISAQDLANSLEYPALVDRLRQAFQGDATVPVRHHHTISNPGGADPTLLLMPAWQQGTAIGVKIVAIFPDNSQRGLPAVNAAVLLIDGESGAMRALIDGAELTARRTACASALASAYLSRPDSERLLMVGTGVMAPHLIRAHASQRPIRAVEIWGRSPEKAERLAGDLAGEAFSAAAVTDLAAAVGRADIISCATLARDPLIHGEWLEAGQHLDLVGGFTPEMREADDEAVRRARVFVDTRDGAMTEAGDVVVPLANGVISRDGVLGDLFDLTRGVSAGRENAEEITFFKSVGTALEDLAAATLAFESA